MDRGDEIVSNLLEICEKESIPSAVFSGIGGCQSAELQVFIPERLRVGERSSWTSQAAEPSAGMTGNGAIGKKFDPETGTGFWNF